MGVAARTPALQVDTVLQELGSCISPPTLAKVLAAQPEVLQSSLGALHERMERVRRLPNPDNVVKKFPLLLCDNSGAVRILDQVRALGDMLDMDEASTWRVVLRFPLLLAFKHETLLLRYESLRKLMHDNPVAMVRMISVCPRVLSYRPDSVSDKVQYFAGLTGLSPEKVLKIVMRSPSLLSSAIDTVEERLRNVAATLQCSEEEQKEMMRKCCMYVTLDWDNVLQPKIDYLINAAKLNTLLIKRHPVLLTLSLKNRIIPRTEFARQHDFPVTVTFLKSSMQDFKAQLQSNKFVKAEKP